jgi:tRNA (cytidine/uridine-2'-O-)-methyltransferase
MKSAHARPLFHIALHEPEIPNNTGNIGRTCVATACALHLIHPLGFDTSEKACRRAGLDYWPRLNVREHADWAAFDNTLLTPSPGPTVWAFTTKATRSVFDAVFQPGDVLLFGKETAGLPQDIRDRYAPTALRLPMAPGERSLNLATAVCAGVYEGLRQFIASGRIKIDTEGELIIGP